MQLRYVATLAAIGLSLAGCQRTADFGPSSSSGAYSPPPLQASPVGGVQSGALPPPASPQAAPGQFPSAPQQSASLNPAGTAPPAAAMDIKKEAMVGSWRVSNGGASCDMFLTLTNLGSGSRGGTRGCTGALSAMGSWEVSGRQVSLKDRNGNVLGTLYKSADNRYEGSTNDGQTVSLSR